MCSPQELSPQGLSPEELSPQGLSPEELYQIKYDTLLLYIRIISNNFKLKLVRQNAILPNSELNYTKYKFCKKDNIYNNICWDCKYNLSIFTLWKWNFNRFLNKYKSIFIIKIFQDVNIPVSIIDNIIDLSLYY